MAILGACISFVFAFSELIRGHQDAAGFDLLVAVVLLCFAFWSMTREEKP
jgi:hypothetical protein